MKIMDFIKLTKITSQKSFADQKGFAGQRGFTLVEIIIVVTILASLIAILGNRVVGAQKKAQVKEAKIQIAEISKFLDIYYTDCGRYPTTAEGLAALAPGGESTCGNWGPEPYLKRVPNDPWNRPYVYTYENGNFNITTYGEDGQPGGSGYGKDIDSNSI